MKGMIKGTQMKVEGNLSANHTPAVHLNITHSYSERKEKKNLIRGKYSKNQH